jgi:hypothetical protein
MKSIGTGLVVCVALLSLSRPAAAQVTQGFETNVVVTGDTGAAAVVGSASDHFLTFSAPVEIPGVGLAPGTYVFRTLAPSVIQVTSEDRSKIYAMFSTIPVSRTEATDNYAMTLKSIRDDAPPQIAAWFVPGSSTGYEPIYPKGSLSTERRLAMK